MTMEGTCGEDEEEGSGVVGKTGIVVEGEELQFHYSISVMDGAVR